MLIKKEADNSTHIWNGEPINGIQYPLAIETRFTEAQLNALDLYKIEPTSVNNRVNIVSTTYDIANNKAVEVHSVIIKTYTDNDVNIERDRRINAGFTYNSNTYQSRPDDRENIAGASQLATLAIIAGAIPGDYQWDGSGNNFTWILENNETVNLDAYDVVNMGKYAAEVKHTLIYKAREIKDNLANNSTLYIYDDVLWS